MQRKTAFGLGLAVVIAVLASHPAKAESLYDKGYNDAMAHLQPDNDSADYREGWMAGREQGGSYGMEEGDGSPDSQEQATPEPEEQSNSEL